MTDKNTKANKPAPQPKVITEKRDTSVKIVHFSQGASPKKESPKSGTNSTGPRSPK